MLRSPGTHGPRRPRRSIRGWRIAYSPDFGAFPVDRRVAVVVQQAVQAFEEAGATVEETEIKLDHDPRELADPWRWLISQLDIEGLAGAAADAG